MHHYEESQNQYFSGRFKKYGFSHKSLSWESPFTQNDSFLELLKVCTMGSKFKDFSLLDFGCGLGHLYKFIKDNGLIGSWGIAYKGVDINEKFVAEASKNFPSARFELKTDAVYEEPFDYTVCSGIYNLKFSEDFDISAHYKQELAKLFNTVRCGLSVNFQTQNALPLIPKRLREGEKERFYFHDPEKLLCDMKTITGNISVLNNYLPGDYDITFCLLK